MALPTALPAPRRPADPPIVHALRDLANGRYRYLLLLSHMRSYSSVLAHLLGASPEISGSGETHVRYRNALDLWRLRRAIRASTGRPPQGPWLLDKVLHNDVRPVDRFAGAERVRTLVFLRRPEASLASLMTLARHHGPDAPTNDVHFCVDYYVSRLHRLRQDGERYGARALYFDAEALVERPRPLLDAIGDWLGLEAPLPDRYVPGPRTGTPGYGDWLPNIRSGRVLGREHSTVAAEPRIDAQALAEARAAYARCRTALMRNCRVAPL